MSLTEIKNNVDTLDKKTKDDLIGYIHELLIYKKKHLIIKPYKPTVFKHKIFQYNKTSHFT
jgi:hypothetical protein